MTFAGHSQTFRDTTCLPNSQLRKALKLVEEGEQAKRENTILYKQINILENRVDIKDSIITNLNEKYNLQVEIKKTYMRDVELYAMENKALVTTIAKLNKDLKKQKRKTTVQKIITCVVVAAGGYLLLK